MRTAIVTAAALLALAAPARLGAIELSLEENRAERGNIGFVDTRRLFQIFPETLKAKENFEEAVRQAEEQINLRKAEVLHLRAELDALKVEREVAAKAPPPAPALSPVVPAPVVPAPVVPPTVLSTSVVSHLPGFDQTPTPAFSSATKTQPLIVQLPGAATGQAVVTPPSGGPVPAPAPAPVPLAVPPVSPLAALDARIAQKSHELERKQTEAKDEQAAAERNLLDLESRRSEILLGKIYKAVEEVARREGVSVVVDKTGILYGHNAVDLTDKVLKYLKGS